MEWFILNYRVAIRLYFLKNLQVDIICPMKTHLRISLVVSIVLFVGLFLLLAGAVLANNPDGGWQVLTPGIEYQEFRQFDSDVYVARMERNNPNVTIDSTIAQGRLSGGLETVSGMFNRYEDTINYWDQSWGKRNNVVVAINGYFFGPDHEPPGVPWRGQIHSGWYAKRHDDYENGSGFVWKLDRTAFIGECVYHQPSEQLITFTGATTSTVKITDVNVPRGDNQLILYTPQYHSNTLTNNNGIEVLVEMTRPTLVLPPAFANVTNWLTPLTDWLNPLQAQMHAPDAQAIGYVRQIRDGQGSTPIPFDHIVLSATGTFRNKLLDNLEVGMQVGISQAVDHYSKNDCNTPLAGKDWTKAYAGIGGSFYFLENGLINSFPGDGQANVKDARTAIAYSEDYIFFIVVDQIIFGDNPGDPADDQVVNAGMNMAELGYFARETLGADFGIAQDGGGSTTMVVNGKVKNVPNDLDDDIIPVPCDSTPTSTPTPTPIGIGGTPLYLPIINQSEATPGPGPTSALAAIPSTCYQGTERFVANGMMMVIVEPMITSTTYTPTLNVMTTITANLRLGPGTNYPVLGTLPINMAGVIEPHVNGLNGVYATGFYWWKVNFGGGLAGWISESVLTGGP